ncbi:MAG: indole-3-glycerol phosphate synthase TrpC, partial [Actinomycetota bacterium]|nr:indole-3-glycerol phosphate synthase TrpC [Actinomycetota bacterium]
ARTRAHVARRRAATPIETVQAAARTRAAEGSLRPFAAALRRPGLAIIAEHKRRSPSAGSIREDLSLEEVVSAYQRGGAAALSILTEEESFGGRLDDLGRARSAAWLPILRKDFIVDPYQVPEALAAGADAILLIVAALDVAELASLHELARSLGLGVLVEVHDRAQLQVAATLGPEMIGINNRDLTTLQVDIGRTLDLLPEVPTGTLSVAESGFRTPAELERLSAAGVDAVLVGEALMRASDIEVACRALAGPEQI